MDNKKIRDGRDRSKIDVNDRNEINYLKSKFPCFPKWILKQAVMEKGPLRKSVEQYLRTIVYVKAHKRRKKPEEISGKR